MTESEQYAQDTIEKTYEDLQPTIVELVRRIAWTYGLPLFLLFMMTTLVKNLLLAFLPESTTLLITTFGSVGAFYFSWRYMDQRYGGTGLFLLYAAFSRERRELKRLLAQPTSTPNGMTLRERADSLKQSAQELKQAVAVRETGV